MGRRPQGSAKAASGLLEHGAIEVRNTNLLWGRRIHSTLEMDIRFEYQLGADGATIMKGRAGQGRSNSRQGFLGDAILIRKGLPQPLVSVASLGWRLCSFMCLRPSR